MFRHKEQSIRYFWDSFNDEPYFNVVYNCIGYSCIGYSYNTVWSVVTNLFHDRCPSARQ